MFGAAAQTGGVNPNKDVQVTPALADGISSLSFSPRANILVATCWDNNVYCWEVASNGQATAKASTSHTQPVLCSSWNADGSAVFTGSCDKTVKMWNLATNQSQQVAQHDGPVRHCAFIPETNLLVTGRASQKESHYLRIRVTCHLLHPMLQPAVPTVSQHRPWWRRQ